MYDITERLADRYRQFGILTLLQEGYYLSIPPDLRALRRNSDIKEKILKASFCGCAEMFDFI